MPPNKPHSLTTFAHTQQYNLYILLGLACLMILTGLGLRDPWPADEPRFAQIAIEMVNSGQWFFPTRGGELYPDKPPVFMWFIALFYWISGSIKFAFLLPSALSALLTVYLVYDLGRRLWSAQTGFVAGLLLLFTVQFTLQAKTAQIDAMVCCWITLGCYGLLRFLLVDGLWRWYFMAWFFMGLGVITKGVGFLPLLMLLPVVLLRLFNQRDTVTQRSVIAHNWRWWLGPVVMLLAISLWFIPMLVLVEHSQNPLYQVYRDNILFKQTVTRYADSWHHIKPFWYYITSVIPLFWLPLSVLLPWLLLHWSRAFKARDYRIILPLAWIALVLVFFSASPGKRGVYILPALPMLALISAPYVAELLQKKWPVRIVWCLVGVLSACLLSVAFAGWFELSWAAKLSLKYQLEPWNLFGTIGFCGLAIFLLGLGKRWFKWLSWPMFISCVWLFYSTWGYVLFTEVKTPKSLFAAMQPFVPAGAELGLVKFSEQFILFSPYAVTHFGYHTAPDEQLRAAWDWLGLDNNKFILLDRALVTQCFDLQDAKQLGFVHGEHWVLLSADDRLADCSIPQQKVPVYRYQP